MGMKLKHVLALASLLIGVGSLQAQTNLFAGWDGGTNTNSPSEFGWTSSASRALQKRNYGSGIRMMTTYTGYKLEDGTAYAYDASSDPSSVIFWVRYNTAGESFTYTFRGLEAGHIYKFSGLLGWHNNSNTPTMTVEVRGTNSIATTSKTISAKQTLYAADMGFTVPADETATDFQLIFTCNQTGDCMEAISALSLVEDFDAYLPPLQGKLDEANAMKEAKMDATVAANLTTAITNAQAVIDGNDHTLATINAVLIPLTSAIDAANASIAAVRAAAKAEAMKTQGTEAAPADWTKVIANPGFEEYETLVRNTKGGKQNNPAGWSNSKTWGDDAWNYAVKSTENATEGKSSFKVRFNWAADTYTLSQTVTALPRGKYKMTVDVKNYNVNGSKCNAKLSINDFETESTITGATTLEKVFTLSEEGDININLTATYILGNGSCEGILYWDNVTLKHYGDDEEAIEAAELAEAKWQLQAKLTAANTLYNNGANVGTGVFQIPEAAGTAFQTAIATAQSICDESTDKAAVTDAIEALEAAINIFNEADLIVPDEKDAFNLYLVDGINKTVTFKVGNPTSGGYAIGYTDDAGSFYNQAIHFKSTSTKNQYKLYIEDSAGKKFYLCTGSVYEGNDYQIRVTDNENNALAVEVIVTAENNVYNLKNTAVNALIGSNGDTGAYTAQKYKNFNINPAEEVSVTVSCKTGKYGTVIFPFTPDVSTGFDGITFYSCETVNGATGKVQITEVDTPVANVPYLIKNEGGENLNKGLTGWGTATADSYTEGLLTGVYTAATIPASDGNTTNYVLQTQADGQAFYKVDTDFTATPYKCYLTVTSSEVKAFFLDFGGEDAINGIEAETENAEIFNLAGQRVNKAQRGIYIVNGKKVLVK